VRQPLEALSNDIARREETTRAISKDMVGPEKTGGIGPLMSFTSGKVKAGSGKLFKI
jgi:hypothetical protein